MQLHQERGRLIVEIRRLEAEMERLITRENVERVGMLRMELSRVEWRLYDQLRIRRWTLTVDGATFQTTDIGATALQLAEGLSLAYDVEIWRSDHLDKPVATAHKGGALITHHIPEPFGSPAELREAVAA